MAGIEHSVFATRFSPLTVIVVASEINVTDSRYLLLPPSGGVNEVSVLPIRVDSPFPEPDVYLQM